MVTQKELVWIAFAGLLLRLIVGFATPIPAEDGVNYLWMAERFAALDPRAALSEVFPPLHPLLIAPWIALGLEPFRAGQIVAALAGVATLWPMRLVLEKVAPAASRVILWLLVFAPLPVRFGAECYSEPVYVLVATWALAWALGERWLLAGLCAGCAFWARPEAVVIPIACTLTRRLAGSLSWLPFLGGVGLLALARASLGLPWEASAKLTFLWNSLALGSAGPSSALAQIGRNALELPATFFEALSALAVLALLGLHRGAWRRIPGVVAWWLVVGLAVVCTYLTRRRFLVSLLPPVAALAALGMAALPGRLRTLTLYAGILVHLVLALRVQEQDRDAERLVGERLARMLEPGQTVTGDMTRVIYFAGMRPLPPRHFTADEILAMASAPAVRFVVLGSKRKGAAELVARFGPDWHAPELHPWLVTRMQERGITVLERSR